MSKQPEALRLADWCDANSSGVYRPSAEAAAELRRLHSLNAELVDVARELVASAWFQDSHAASFDGTVIFGPGYDYSDINGPFREEFLAKYDCIVWPSSGGKWSAYCTYDGSMWFERFDSAEAAKEQCMNLLDRVLPDHPVMKARAVIAKAEAQQ